MITLYEKNNTRYDRGGSCTLMPLSAKIKMVAGGAYELDLVHPIDPYGKWRWLETEAIIKAPVPKETITTSHSGVDCDVYRTTEATPMREGTSEDSTITYSAWSINSTYSAGSRVSYASQNWQCTQWDGTSYLSTVPPGANHPWWRQIARTQPGSPIIVNLKNNTKLYYVSGPSSGWYKLETKDGVKGYVKASAVEYYEHRSASDNPPRTITTQLFRIKTVNVDSDEGQVTVHAVHVSYDLNGVMVSGAKMNKAYAPAALAKIEDAFMSSYAGEIATDLPTGSGKKYTGEIDGKSGMYALVDPDKGIVPAFQAELRRDNWDLFVMKKVTHDRGYHITYGNNMLGVHWHQSTDNLITRVIPVAKKADGTNLFLSSPKWVNSDNISNFPVVYCEWLRVAGQVGRDDGSETATNWTTSTLRDEMERQAQNRFDVDHCDTPEYDVTVEFEMLGDTAEYAFLKRMQTILLYDTVKVYDAKTGTTATVTVEELEYDAVHEKVTAVKLSNVKNYSMRSVSGYNVTNNSIGWQKITADAVESINEQVKTWVEDNFQTK